MIIVYCVYVGSNNYDHLELQIRSIPLHSNSERAAPKNYCRISGKIALECGISGLDC